MSADLCLSLCVCVCVCVCVRGHAHVSSMGPWYFVCCKNYEVNFFSPIMFVVLYILHVEQITLFHCEVN